MKKLMAGLVGLVLLVAVVSAREVILYEDFNQGFKACDERWDWSRVYNWTYRGYLSYSGPRHSSTAAWFVKPIKLYGRSFYKLEIRYRYGPASIYWGERRLGKLEEINVWRDVIFYFPVDHTAETTFIIWASEACLFDFDDVILTRCGSAVTAESMGRIKALYR